MFCGRQLEETPTSADRLLFGETACAKEIGKELGRLDEEALPGSGQL